MTRLSQVRSALVATAVCCGIAVAVLTIALCPGVRVRAAVPRPGLPGDVLSYASPVEMLFSPDGQRLYVLCQGTDEVRVLDAATYKPLNKIVVGHIPRGFSFSPDGRRLYVANTWDDTISIIDTQSLQVTGAFHAGAEPTNVVESRNGKWLFTADRISNDVDVLDPHTGQEMKRLAAGRGASYITPSPDGSLLYVTHVYPIPTRESTMGGDRGTPHSEITVIDADRATIAERIPLPFIAHSFHIAFSRDGRLGVLAALHPKNLVPLAHLEHSGAFADTLMLFGADVGTPVEVPLDEIERYASRPFAVAITADKSKLFVTCEGSEIVTVIDVPRLLRFVRTHPGSHAQDLSASSNYVITHIKVGRDPRGLAFTPDGQRLLVANRLDDALSIIDVRTNRVVFVTKLESPRVLTALRHGEQTFYSSDYSFQGQIGCANCHIDSTFDGLAWDLEPDGFGRDIVDNRLIEDLKGTEPYKWNGGNPDLPTECGPRTEKFFWRSENYDDLTLADLVLYIRSIPPRPNRWRKPGGELTDAQERGKVIFERSVDNFRKPIALENRCSYCHSGPKGTNQKSFDVGTSKATDGYTLLDTPQLVNIALTGPYLHDGSAHTLEEIWTVFNPEDKHGRTNDLTKDELNDLIEYLRTR